jgi:hypothetical protein
VLHYIAAVTLGGSIAILLAAGILAFMNFVSPEQRQKLTGAFKARAKRPFRRRAPARGTARDRRIVRHIWHS